MLDLNGHALASESFTVYGAGISSSGAIINTSGTAATVAGSIIMASNTTFSGTGDYSIDGVLSGGFNFTKTGTNTITLSGTNTYTGQANINAGTLLLTSEIDSDIILSAGILAGGNGATSVSNKNLTLSGTGTVSPGNGVAAQLTLGDATTDTFNWTAGTYVWEVAGNMTDSGTDNDSDGVTDADGYGSEGGLITWDILSFSGALNLSGASTGSITIDINEIGSITQTTTQGSYLGEMKILVANNIIGFNESYFTLDSSGFSSQADSTVWKIYHHDNALWLAYQNV